MRTPVTKEEQRKFSELDRQYAYVEALRTKWNLYRNDAKNPQVSFEDYRKGMHLLLAKAEGKS